ncbi:MAG: hypothetical protein ACFB16_09960 [Phormidesmis sp.]
MLTIFEQEVESQQLYYHGLDHVTGVARKAELIFDTVIPFYTKEDTPKCGWDRQRSLLYLSAIAHDMQQIFLPQSDPHSSRRRRSGDSEKATVDKLIEFLQQTSLSIKKPNNRFNRDDIAIIKEAIEATICEYDATDGSIYQPSMYSQHRALYGDGQPISLVARCLALADIGTLGIEGIAAYNREGSLLFLEENLDIIPFIKNKSAYDQPFRENVRQRLLKRARFEIAFARGRLNRLDTELEGLPQAAIASLKQNVFKHLTPDTLEQLKRATPTADNTSLATLLDYFQLERYVL